MTTGEEEEKVLAKWRTYWSSEAEWPYSTAGLLHWLKFFDPDELIEIMDQAVRQTRDGPGVLNRAAAATIGKLRDKHAEMCPLRRCP